MMMMTMMMMMMTVLTGLAVTICHLPVTVILVGREVLCN